MSKKIENVKTVKGFRTFLSTEIKDHHATADRIVSAELVNDNDFTSAEKQVKRELHHIGKKGKLTMIDDQAMEKALAFFKSALRDFSGNDIDKIRTLSEALEKNDPENITSGLFKALQTIAKIEVKSGQKDQISVTEISRHHAHKNNVRTSFTLLDKLGLIKQVKEARSVVGYSLNWNSPLVNLINLFK